MKGPAISNVKSGTMAMLRIGASVGNMRVNSPLLCAVILAMLLAGVPARASAEEPMEGPQVISFEQQDLNQDATPDVATITADYWGDRYRVVVYDQGLDMQWSDDWRAGTDFANDIWLFQAAGDGQTKLIVRFSQGPGGYLAELYDDVDGDGDVSYEIWGQTGVEIVESPYPTLDVTAEKPWLLPGGRANDIVRFTTYRPWTIPFMQAAGLPYLPQDGRPTYTHEVVDSDGNGIADYELRRALPELPAGRRVFTSAINANLSQTALSGFEGGFFWPYLGYADPEGWSIADLGRSLGDLTPPVQIDWQAGRVRGIRPFLPTIGLGDQWKILSLKPIEKGRVNELDWEVFAYYDFTGDTVMDVLMRLIYQPVEPVHVGNKQLHLQQVSYAWHHRDRDTPTWDYELEMAAWHELPSTVVEFEDFGLYTVPYEDLLDHFSRPSDWAYATFVAAENNAYRSSEGIWEWGTTETVQTDVSLPPEQRGVPGSRQAQYEYLFGNADSSPAGFYTRIREGFRGEYADLLGPARLYFGAVDRRLHLAKAQTGVWNLGDGRELQYGNLGGDYLDTWTLLDGGEPAKALYAPPGYLIYQDFAGVQLFEAQGQANLFTAVPPRSRAEWLALEGDLAQHQPAFAPDDFLAMAQQSGEPLSTISTASLRDLRLTDEGFRFILSLGPGFTLTGKDLLGLDNLAPGEYVVILSEGRFSVQPFTSARVTLELELDTREDSLNTVRAALANEGLADLKLVQLSFVQICAGHSQEFGGQVTDLYGGESQTVSVRLPLAEGEDCTVEARVLDGVGTILKVNRIEIPPGDAADQARRLLQTSAGGGFPGFPFLLLGSLTALVGMLAAAFLRKGAR